MASAFRQDMPPPGGYAPVRWGKVAQKRMLGAWLMTGIYLGVTGWAWYRHNIWKEYLKKLDIEKFDAFVAMEPFVTAERDRL